MRKLSMKNLLTPLLLLAATINLLGQEPPMPPMPPTLNHSVAGNEMIAVPVITTNIILVPRVKAAPRIWTKPTLFTVNCPDCNKTLKGVPALAIKVDNRHWMTNGIRVERTVRLACPDCHEEFDALNMKFLPKPIAVEEGDQPQASAKSMSPTPPIDTQPPTVSLDDTSKSTILNFPNAVPFSWRCTLTNLTAGYTDYLTGQYITNRIEVKYNALTNRCYLVWWTTNVSKDYTVWQEWDDPTTKNYTPTTLGTNVFYLPVVRSGPSRFYWLRST